MAKINWTIKQLDIERDIIDGTTVKAEIIGRPALCGGGVNPYTLAGEITRVLNNTPAAAPAVLPEVERVIYNPPATIVLWADKTKTVVKCSEDDIYSRAAGFAMACLKKALGDNYKKFFKTNKLKIEKSCKSCKYKGLYLFNPPCRDCFRNSKWEAAK